jgi:EAL domain-containing protein (putative c-di-GMP-specific phosphodiesterase class I)
VSAYKCDQRPGTERTLGDHPHPGGPAHDAAVRFLSAPRRAVDERLLWSRDIRFVRRLATRVKGGRLLELDTGTVLIGPVGALTEAVAAEVAKVANAHEYGLVAVDDALPERDRYLVAMSAAVQLSGLADRIGMAQSTQVVQTKMLDYFFSLRKLHAMAFQPIVTLATGELYEYECLLRPQMPMLPQSITSVVSAAINTDRGIERDIYIVARALEQIGRLEASARAAGRPPHRYALNLTPFSLLDPAFEANALGALVRAADIDPRQMTIECTEQQSVSDIVALKRQVKALRKVGFGFAVDDAGAGYASFALIAALRPSVIKIDRAIIGGIGHDDAKQALVEAFVSFGRRIGAHLLAEGIERRADLSTLKSLGVELGQGYLLGRPAVDPAPPRQLDRPIRARRTAANADKTLNPAGPPARVPSRA